VANKLKGGRGDILGDLKKMLEEYG